MKKLILTLTASLACVAAFAQGKIGFQTDANHLVYFDPSVAGVGGQAANSTIQPVPLAVDLYMGTSSTALSLYSSTTLANSANPGKWGAVSVQASSPFIGGGTTVFVVTQIRNTSAAAEATLDPSAGLNQGRAQALGFSWYGWSQEFTFALGSAVTYPVMYNAPSWTAGAFDLSATAGAGAKGAIAVFSVPEPTSFAMAGLGLAAVTIFRRRR